MPDIRVLDDVEFNSHVVKLINSGGSIEEAGLTLDDVRNMIYTRKVKINPEILTERSDGDASGPSGNKVPKVGRSKGPTLKGADLNDFLS